MAMHLEILNGEKAGTIWTILDGKTIGRKIGDYIVPDIKASAQHAKLVLRGDRFYLIDLGSANGIKFGGQTVKELEMVPAVEFSLGRTNFRVSASPELVMDTADSPSKSLSGDDLSDSLGPSPVIRAPAWIESLIAMNDFLRTKVNHNSRSISFAKRPVILKVIQGNQTGEEWSIGYGPRRFGSDPLENTIWDEELPLVYFQIHFENGGPLIRSDTVNLVFLNDVILREQRLSNGDIIRVKNTKIKVILKS